MIKGCAFDVGNTLINDTRFVQDTLEDIADWLKKKRDYQAKEAFYHYLQ